MKPGWLYGWMRWHGGQAVMVARGLGRGRGGLLACLLVCWAAFPAAAPAQDQGPVHTYTLDNGMRILVRPDDRAPVVSSMVWYRVGSSYEHSGITGISHALEHMMFKGTQAHPAGEFSRIISELGGRENAFTGRDYTAYYQQLASEHLGKALELEADRMQHLTLPEEAFRREMQVIREERRLRTEDDPNALTWEHFRATAWFNSPYGQPVIGWMSDIEAFTVKDLRDWYARWYTPSNALLVVAGDVDPDAVQRMAQEYFGGIPSRTVPEVKPREEPPQRGERRITVQAPARVPYLAMGYKAPSLPTAAEPWEAYALLVAAGILDGGDSARIPRELVRGRELAASAGAGYSPFSRLDTLFTLWATPAPGEDLQAVEAALTGMVARLRESPPTPQELERVKAQVIAEDVYRRDSIHGQAMRIGLLESIGLSWREGEAFAERVQAVTAEQVQAVARKYLLPSRRTVAWLEPVALESGGGHETADDAEGEVR
ncbi:zinc protease [Ectothiorhodospira mobilis]|uniref:Zinc protease n=2 Tax=Ectothiorhodospira mobilis TaxID=195064 RepID=A0A1I4S6P2_ECTMO|nr:zinc protease [Ectothiorhodospira mobilis]